MLDDKDIYKLLFNPSQNIPEGVYDHRTWSTYSGSESDSVLVQLTSLHESFHNELNNLTFYGNTLSAYAHLAQQQGNEESKLILEGLVTQCRDAHEIYATFLSCSVISSYNKSLAVEHDLLQNHTSYISYYNRGKYLVRLFQGNYLQEILLTAIIISCFQDSDYINIQLNDFSSFKINKVRSKHFPDSRLSFLAKNLPEDFLQKAFATFIEHHKDDSRISIFLETESDPNAYLEAIKDKYDSLQQSLSNYFIVQLSAWFDSYGYKTMPLEKNLPLLQDLYNQVNGLSGPNYKLMVLNDQQLNYERNVLLNFTAEKYYVLKAPIKAFIYPINDFGEEDWDKLSSGDKANEHHFIVSRMPERILKQYLFDENTIAWLDTQKEIPLVLLRRRVKNTEENIEVIELIHIPNIELLHKFINRTDKKIISNISMHTWAIESWASKWVDALSSGITPTVLFDLPPHSQLESLFGSGSLKVKINLAWMNHKDYRHCALVIESQIDLQHESPLFFIPASNVTCNVISNYMLKNMKPGLVVEDEEFMSRNSSLINTVVTHLFNETYFFNFNV